MTQATISKWSWTPVVVLWVYAAAASAWVASGLAADSTTRVLVSLAEVPAEIVVLLMMLPLIGALGPGYRRWGWMCAFGAIFIDVLGNIGWSLQQLPPYDQLTELSDALSIIYYALIAAAFAMFFLELGGTFRSWRVWLDAITMTLGLAATAWLFLLSQAIDQGGVAGTDLAKIFAYSLGEGATMICIALLFMQIMDWRAECGMLLLIAAVIMGFVGDLAWFGTRVSDLSHADSAITVFGYCSYSALVAAAVHWERRRGDGNKLERIPEGNAYGFLPVLSVLLAIAMLIGDQAHRHGFKSSIAIAFVLIGGALLTARQLSVRFELRRLNRALAQQEADLRFTELVRRSSDVIVIVNQLRQLAFVSPASETVLGIASSALRFAPAVDLLGPGNKARLASFLDHIELNRSATDEIEVVVSTPAGERRTLHVVGSDQMANPAIAGIALTLRDVSKERRLESELLESAVLERELMSGDLHEGLGQELTGIALLVKSLNFGPNAQRDVMESTRDGIVGQVNRTIALARQLASGLSPVRVARGSLDLALDRLAAEASERYALRVTFRHRLTGSAVSASEADHLYRIAQESLLNAVRQGGCSAVDIDLDIIGDHLTLSIAVDGDGVVGESRMIAYRARVMGGQMSLDHPVTGGTRMQVIVPLRGGLIPNQTTH